MFKRILKLLGKPIFRNNIEWMINNIIENIDSINIDIIYIVEIKTIINSKHKPLDIIELTNYIINIRRLVDETTNTIPNEMAIGTIEKSKRLIDYITINNRVSMNYKSMLVELFKEYIRLREIYMDLNMNDLTQEYNSKIIDIYIINMDRIIQSLYEVING